MNRAADTLFEHAGVHLCGHRGHSINGHENTVTAIQDAQAYGASLCEIDIRLTADEQFVVFHDDILNDASTGSGSVRAHTLNQLCSLNHRQRDGAALNDKLLSLEDTLAIAAELNIGLVIEAKDRITESSHVKRFLSAVNSAGLNDKVLYSSFDHRFLRELKDSYPSVSTFGIVHARLLSPIDVARSAKFDVYSINYPRLDLDRAAELRTEGIRVAHFLPRPEYFKRRGEDGVKALQAIATAANENLIDMIGCDDIEWGTQFFDEYGIKSPLANLSEVS